MKSGKDILLITKEEIEMYDLDAEITRDIYECKIDDVVFHALETTVPLSDHVVTLKQYVTVLHGYAFVMNLSAIRDDEMQELDSIVETLVFD